MATDGRFGSGRLRDVSIIIQTGDPNGSGTPRDFLSRWLASPSPMISAASRVAQATRPPSRSSGAGSDFAPGAPGVPIETVSPTSNGGLSAAEFERRFLSMLTFCNWDWRPAVLTPDRLAYAVLEPGGPWVAVDELDVAETAGVMPEDAWRRTFERKFGPLDLSKIPAHSAPSHAKTTG